MDGPDAPARVARLWWPMRSERSPAEATARADEDPAGSDDALLGCPRSQGSASSRGAYSRRPTAAGLLAGLVVVATGAVVGRSLLTSGALQRDQAAKTSSTERRSVLASADLPQLAEAEAACETEGWARKSLVCGNCQVLVESFGLRPPRLRKLSGMAGEQVKEGLELGTCEAYCGSIGRACRGSRRAAMGGASCAAADGEPELGCAAQLPAGQAICHCSVGEREQVPPRASSPSSSRQEEALPQPEEEPSARADASTARVPTAPAAATATARSGSPTTSGRASTLEVHAEAGSMTAREAAPRGPGSRPQAEASTSTSRAASPPPSSGTAPRGTTTTQEVQLLDREAKTLDRSRDQTAEAVERAGRHDGRGHQTTTPAPKGRHAPGAVHHVPATTSAPKGNGRPDNSTHPVLFPCGRFADDTDFWTKALIAHTGGIYSAADCDRFCAESETCGAWTWGKVRDIEGLSDVCFTKLLDSKGSVVRVPKVGVVSGMKSDCSLQPQEDGRRAALVVGVMKNRHGNCLRAADPGADAGRLEMWACSADDPKQQWAYEGDKGRLKSLSGGCLHAVDRTRDYTLVQTHECDSTDEDQQWAYDANTGAIKSWNGVCLDAAEYTVDGGAVYMQTCMEDSWEQHWQIGALEDLPVEKDSSVQAGTSLYCFALMMPGSYEQALLATQFHRKVSLFECEDYTVWSNQTIKIVQGLDTGVVRSDLSCGKGGEFGTALNLGIFLAVWDKVAEEKIYKRHDWTIKVDPDAVFFVGRLRAVLLVHRETPRGVYINNCKFGLHGPLEVLSRNAVTSWTTGKQKCLDHFWALCHGDCLWGEDMFIDQCLWRVLDVRREADYRLLVEDHCDPPKDWNDCSDPDKVAFHPFKKAQEYMDCLGSGAKEQSGEQTREGAELERHRQHFASHKH